MKSLTKGEEQVMQAIVEAEKRFLERHCRWNARAKTTFNTVATLLKILVDKTICANRITWTNAHEYEPLISKQAYFKNTMNGLVKGYFDGSFAQAVSFLVDEKKISVSDLELLLQEVKKK